MTTYTLKATLKNTGKSLYTFTASNDTEATFEAIREILDRAMSSVIWAKGAIELRDGNGNLVREMSEK